MLSAHKRETVTLFTGKQQKQQVLTVHVGISVCQHWCLRPPQPKPLNRITYTPVFPQYIRQISDWKVDAGRGRTGRRSYLSGNLFLAVITERRLSWDKEATETGEKVSPCSDDFNKPPAPVSLSLSAQFDMIRASGYVLELSVS